MTVPNSWPYPDDSKKSVLFDAERSHLDELRAQMEKRLWLDRMLAAQIRSPLAYVKITGV